MTGTLPARADLAPAPAPVPVESGRRRPAVRPWSAVVVGLPEDRTLLVVDWLLLACRAAGVVAQAVPLPSIGDMPYGMYVEVAGDADAERCLGEVPWGAVDLLVAGEHLELMRAITAGFVHPQETVVVASSRRSYTPVERVATPEHVLEEREIDALATRSARSYHAFDGHEVAGWYDLPSSAQPGLLLGALCGTGVTGLEASHFEDAIRTLGIDDRLHAEAFRRGTRLGRREGGRVRRAKTAYQFTRRRRALVAHHSRRRFEELVARAEVLVHVEHRAALQEAIFLLCEFQDADWAGVLVDHLEAIVAAERDAVGGEVDPDRSVVPDAIRSLAGMMTWPDAAWIANRKRRASRLRELRAAHRLSRLEAYELVDHVPLDAVQRAECRRPSRLGFATPDASVPPLLRPVRVEQLRTSSIGGAMRLRRMAAGARWRVGSPQQRLELDTVETWLEALHDSMRVDHSIARIVARSGTLVQGMGAVREAHRATAHAFWGRIVRQSIAIDRTAGRGADAPCATQLVPFVWNQLCRSGPLALWEYAAQVLGIALAQARGTSPEDTIAYVTQLCAPKRPLD